MSEAIQRHGHIIQLLGLIIQAPFLLDFQRVFRIELTLLEEYRLIFRVGMVSNCYSEEHVLLETKSTINRDSCNFPQNIRNYTIEFNRNDLFALLAQPDCKGLRFFPGLCNTTTSSPLLTLVVVGVESKGFDIDKGAGYIRSRKVEVRNVA